MHDDPIFKEIVTFAAQSMRNAVIMVNNFLSFSHSCKENTLIVWYVGAQDQG